MVCNVCDLLQFAIFRTVMIYISFVFRFSKYLRSILPLTDLRIFKYSHEYWHRSHVQAKHHFSLPNHFKKAKFLKFGLEKANVATLITKDYIGSPFYRITRS